MKSNSLSKDEVTLRCTKCRRTMRAARDPTDPPNAATVEVLCDLCDDGGGFPETFYFDMQGRQINCDGGVL